MIDAKRILVALDFTEMDKYLISFLVNNKALFKNLENAYFIHVETEMSATSDEVGAPIDEVIVEREKSEVLAEGDEWLNERSSFTVVEGNPLKKLLHWADIKKVDLLIVGKKRIENGSGILMQRLARKIKTSVLIVPEKEIKVKDILLSVDFSEHSDLAIGVAKKITNALPESNLVGQHLFQVPTGYTKTGKTFEEMEEIMRGHAETAFNQFLKKNSINSKLIEQRIGESKTARISDKIIETSKELNADLIIIGSKGQTFASWMLLGSIAEKLIVKNNEAALLIVKKKNENFNFWKAFQEI